MKIYSSHIQYRLLNDEKIALKIFGARKKPFGYRL